MSGPTDRAVPSSGTVAAAVETDGTLALAYRPPFDWDFFLAFHTARALMNLGRFEEAERFLKRAEEIRGQSVVGSRDRLADEVLCGSIALYRAWQRPDKVAEYERRRAAECGIPPRP